ncbi:hypothetical protein [Marinobacter sp.]|uniref:hypothetical protein n=1 Tax=Marinobacter sp. TaxID=50741 RepID=UPI003A8FD0E7
MGLSFPNRLGIAAGFDTTGKLGRLAGNLGFGAIELGNWTQENWPVSSPSASAETLLDTRLGVRLAATTPASAERETLQLVQLIEKAWKTADYLCIAPGWLAESVAFEELRTNLDRLLNSQQALTRKTRKHCPIVCKLKVVPGNKGPTKLVQYLASRGVDGILISFDFGKPGARLHYSKWQHPALQSNVCRTIEACRRRTSGTSSVLMTNGGVLSRQDYLDRLRAGADLVQLHNALLLKGVDIGWEFNQ